jgi:hypothetical protein
MFFGRYDTWDWLFTNANVWWSDALSSRKCIWDRSGHRVVWPAEHIGRLRSRAPLGHIRRSLGTDWAADTLSLRSRPERPGRLTPHQRGPALWSIVRRKLTDHCPPRNFRICGAASRIFS